MTLKIVIPPNPTLSRLKADTIYSIIAVTLIEQSVCWYNFKKLSSKLSTLKYEVGIQAIKSTETRDK